MIILKLILRKKNYSGSGIEPGASRSEAEPMPTAPLDSHVYL